MSENVSADIPARSGSGTPILTQDEVSRRMLVLSRLQAALEPKGLHSVLARNHRLVLRYNDPGCGRSGLTDPVLHIFGPGGSTRNATTDTTVYRTDEGREYPAADPAIAAVAIGQELQPASAP